MTTVPEELDVAATAPLAGIRVLDATQGISGPYASSLLMGLGADVVKLEPVDGDWLRAVGPPWIDGMGAAAYQLNRGKASVALHWMSPRGTTVLLRMLRQVDVFLHDLTLTRAAEVGLTPDVLRRTNPDLIDVSVTPLGEVGPWADLPATELEVQSLSGVFRYLGQIDEPPVRLGADVGGILGGCTAVQAVLAGLLARDTTGGQHAAVSQLGAVMGANNVMIAALDAPDAWEGFHCNAATYPPDRGIATADGRLYYGQPLRSEDAWQEFCRAIGAEALLEDPRFATRALRMPNMADLRRELEPYFVKIPTDELMELIVRSDGIGVPVHDYATLRDHAQLAALQQIVPAAGAETLSLPWRRQGEEFAAVTKATAAVGEHTVRFLRSCGLADAELGELTASGLIHQVIEVPGRAGSDGARVAEGRPR
jgi:crotonobetainyl-CoA:carnitine CoA-transferase CaiB-like acyl-CoA transferase